MGPARYGSAVWIQPAFIVFFLRKSFALRWPRAVVRSRYGVVLSFMGHGRIVAVDINISVELNWLIIIVY